MATVSQAAGSRREIVLGDTKLSLRPLTARQLGDLENYIADIPLREVRRQLELLGDAVPPGAALEMIKQAREESRSLRSISSEAAQQALQSFNGITYMLYLSAQIEHPELTYDAVLKLFDNLSDINMFITEVNTVVGELNETTGKPIGVNSQKK